LDITAKRSTSIQPPYNAESMLNSASPAGTDIDEADTYTYIVNYKKIVAKTKYISSVL
jgi:hypothetical protein